MPLIAVIANEANIAIGTRCRLDDGSGCVRRAIVNNHHGHTRKRRIDFAKKISNAVCLVKHGHHQGDGLTQLGLHKT
jgi:hypothetical protein